MINYLQWGRDAQLSVPTSEHFLPLRYMIGTWQDDETTSIAIDGLKAGAISMLAAVVGDAGLHLPNRWRGNRMCMLFASANARRKNNWQKSGKSV